MTAQDVKISLAKVSIGLGALVALVMLTTAFKGWLTEQYVTRTEYQQDAAATRADIASMRADLRVLRCKVAQDCP